MPRTPADAGTRLDPGGVLLVSASFALIYPLVQGRELGWPVWTFALMVPGSRASARSAAYERRHRRRR